MPTQTNRTWKPVTDALVKLKTWSDYTTRGINVWACLKVLTTCGNGHDMCLSIMDVTTDTLQRVIVPLDAIAPPIGWHERYTITVSPDKVDTVLSWFERGITVRQSHYMPECSTAFQPMDNDDVPGWKFAGDTVVERVKPENCTSIFRVVKLESEMDPGIPTTCPHCVNGKRTPENNPVLVGHDTEDCPHCGNVAGFSFDRPYHPKGYRYGYVDGITMDNSQCGNVRTAGECWVCNGTGIGKRYLSELSPKERKQAIADMTRDGWRVFYVRSGSYWVRERETVVKDWDNSEVSA